MKRFIALLLCFFICHPAEAVFSFYRSITVDFTKVPNTDQSNFPVLVTGNYTYLATVANGGKVQNSSGFDVGFYTSNDCVTGKMNWETELYTASNGTVAYWINSATVSHTVNTVFYMCYDDSSISTDQSNKTAVWDANYKTVWHSNETGGTALTDSTGNLNGTRAATPTTSGQIDGAQSYNGSSDNVSLGTNAINPLINGASGLTLEYWISYASLSSTDDNTLLNELISGGSNGLYFLVRGDAGNVGKTQIFARSQVADSLQSKTSGGALSSNTLSYVVATINYSTAQLDLFINGSDQTASGATFGSSTYSAGVGTLADTIADYPFPSNTSFFNGIIDEIRISNSVRNSDWINTEYNNQNSPSTFYAVGNEAGLHNVDAMSLEGVGG